MDEDIAEVAKLNPELGAKMAEAWKARATEFDGQRQTAAAAAKTAKAAAADAAKYKADLEAASKGGDEAAKTAQRERDEARATAEKVTAEHTAFKLRTKLERKLGIANETKAKRAVGALLETHGADISFDDAGELVGADAAIESFKKAEDFWFRPDDDTATAASEKKPAGARAGSGPTPGKVANKPATPAEKISNWRATLAPPKSKGASA